MENFDKSHLKGWNKDDKFHLFSALRAYGSYNIEELLEHIPNKTKEEIEEALHFFKHKALRQEDEINTTKEPVKKSDTPQVPLNSWAKLLTETFPFNELRTETATALRLIADFEDTPRAVCTDKIDFRKVYHTLANALEGKTLFEDKNVAAVIDKCIIETALTSKAFMRCKTFRKALKHIRIYERNISPFIKPTENNELSVLRQILMQKNYNPMNIPEEHLKFSLLP